MSPNEFGGIDLRFMSRSRIFWRGEFSAEGGFDSKKLRWSGPYLFYRLSKPTHTGQTSI